jgi:hypothetical protein
MRWFPALLGAAVLSAGSVASAHANVYDFSFFGKNVSGSGVITTGNTGSPYAATGVTGTIFDSEVGPGPFTITTLSGYAAADNLVYFPTQPFVDFGGLSFFTATGGQFNLGLGGGGPYGYVLNASVVNPIGYANVPGSTDITLSVSQTPLPPAWTMMLIGFAGLGCMLYRKTKPEVSIDMAAA